MIINKDTKLYFSISSNPGNFGATMYNAAFKYMGINAIYKPLKISNKTSFDSIIDFAIGTDAVSGISVSMPWKKEAAKLCQENLTSVNTIIPFSEFFMGYNTDSYGFESSCSLSLSECKGAIIFGRGSLAETIANVLKNRNVPFFMTKEGDALLSAPEYNFLINATPVGMDHIPDTIFTKKIVKNFDFIFDCVVKKETNLITLAKELNKRHVNGVSMCYNQICRQFEIYTNKIAPAQIFRQKLREGGYA